jgi:hypothetical protein
MSDDNEIERARQRRQGTGDEFAFELFKFDEEGVGYLDDDDDHPICVLLNAEALRGVRMSVPDALALTEALAGCVQSYLFDNELSPIVKAQQHAERADGLFKSTDAELNRIKSTLQQTMIELEDAKRALVENRNNK